MHNNYLKELKLRDSREQKLRKKFTKLCKKHNLTIDYIWSCGFDLPSFSHLCGGTDCFVGRGIYLYNSFYTNPDNKDIEEKRNILKDIIASRIYDKEDEMIHQGIDSNKRKELLYNLFYEELKAAYINVLKEEEKLGIYRFACTLKRFSEESLVVSKHNSEKKINFSPRLIQFEDFSDIETLAARFAEAVLKKQSCFLFSIIIKNTSNYKNVNLFARKLISEFNIFFIDEFNKCKNNQEYQHRNDFNPDFF